MDGDGVVDGVVTVVGAALDICVGRTVVGVVVNLGVEVGRGVRVGVGSSGVSGAAQAVMIVAQQTTSRKRI